jgi:hypothetical protein
MKRSLLVAGMCAGLWMIVPFLAAAQDSSKIVAMENLWNRAELSNDANVCDFCSRMISS